MQVQTILLIDQELLNACVINSWSVTPRMMLIDSMIESGLEEFKALEAFEPPTLSQCLPSIYGVGYGAGYGAGDGYGSGNIGGYGGYNKGSDGNGSGGGGNSAGRGRGNGYGNSNGYRDK